jgi:hypothetical protein
LDEEALLRSEVEGVGGSLRKGEKMLTIKRDDGS